MYERIIKRVEKSIICILREYRKQKSTKKVFYEKKFNERKLKSEEKELGATKLL